jgi:hypothetical protein
MAQLLTQNFHWRDAEVMTNKEDVSMNTLHRLPGRLRARCDVLKGNPKVADGVMTAVRALPGVLSVEVNTVTGSVLVHHDPRRLSSTRVLAELAVHGIRPPSELARPPIRAVEPASARRTLGSVILALVLEHVVQRSLVHLLSGV